MKIKTAPQIRIKNNFLFINELLANEFEKRDLKNFNIIKISYL